MNSSTTTTRREFLNYVWAASIALFMAGSGGMAYWFALPRRKVSIDVEIEQLPGRDQPPVLLSADKLPNPYGSMTSASPNSMYAIQTSGGLMILDRRCTHMGCVMPFSEERQRFECPCHGSNYTPDGIYLAGPSPRGMDRYHWQAFDDYQNVLAESAQGERLPMPTGTTRIRIWTEKLIFGAPSGI